MTVRGKDVMFTIPDAGTDKPVACARSASLTTTADIGETSTLGTGIWKTFKGLKLSFTLSAAGLVSFDINYSLAVLRQKQITLQPLQFTFLGTDDGGNSEKYTGSFIITSISTPTTYNANFEYSLDGQGTGALTIEII
jgi:Phage major tail protein 2.